MAARRPSGTPGTPPVPQRRLGTSGLDRRDAFLPAQLTVLAAILLYLTLPEKLTIGPSWLLPAFEGALLLGLIVLTPRPSVRYSPRRRQVAVCLIGLVSAVNIVSLILLAHFLLQGGKTQGQALVLAGVVVWATNVLLFGLWYWELDRGGPVARVEQPEATPDFLFAQMTDERLAPAGWRPGLLDYLYVSLTNATAFSPTDTMPLTRSAKLLMAVQSLVSLTTLGLVIARAVNILG